MAGARWGNVAVSRLGAMIAARRRERALTQRDLARLAGVSLGRLRDLEQGRTRQPASGAIARLCEVLDLPTEWSAGVPTPRSGSVPPGPGRGLYIRLLGPLQVRLDGVEQPLSAPRQRTLLGLLALSAGEPINTATIIEALWSGDPPANARGLVQTYVSRLRRQLAPQVSAGQRLEPVATSVGGYRLVVTPDELDLLAFNRHVTQARQARSAGDFASALDAYEQGLELWAGAVAADLPALIEHPASVAITRERITATLECAATGFELGAYERVLAPLEATARMEPFDGKIHAQLMIALAGGGHQARALQVFSDVRQRLADQLGVDPDAALISAHQRVVRQDMPPLAEPRTAARQTSGQRPASAADRIVPCLLPPARARLIGRAAEVAQARQVLCAVEGRPRTLIITGAAGAGKTTLALHLGHALADHFPDGQIYTDLRGDDEAADVSRVLGQFVRALGMSAGSVPADPTDRLHVYRSLLAKRRVLVVIDNARDGSQVRDLMPNGAGCGAIVTSRGSLATVDGSRMPLGILSEDHGLSMLREILGPERINSEEPAARDIVRRCGGLPLAIWVAGARLAARPHWPLAAMASALTDAHGRLDVLAVGDVAVRASVSLTYQELSRDAQRALRMLALVPVDDFGAWTLAALLDVPLRQAEQLADELFDVHVLDVCARHPEGVRYCLHDLVRLFARERAMSEDDHLARTAALDRLFDACVGLAKIADARLSADFLGTADRRSRRWALPDEDAQRILADPLAWFDHEYGFLVFIVNHGLAVGAPESAGALAAAMTTFLQTRNHFDDWRQLQTRALVAATAADDSRTMLKLHRNLGELDTIQDRYPDAIAHFEAARQCDVTAFPEYEAAIMSGLGYLHRLMGTYDDALSYLDRARLLAERTGNLNGIVYATNSIGVVHLERGQLNAAHRLFAEGLRLSQAAQYRPGEAQALRCLGQVQRAVENYDAAATYYKQAHEISVSIGDRLVAAHATCWLGDVLRRQGQHREGRRLLAQTLGVYREFGNAWGEAATLTALADAQLAAGRPLLARARARQAMEIWNRIGSPFWTAYGGATLDAACQAVREQAG